MLIRNCRCILLSLAIGWMCAQLPRAYALGEPRLTSSQLTRGGFTLAVEGVTAPIVVSPEDWPGVLRAADDFAHDVERVTGVLPRQLNSAQDDGGVDAVLVEQ